MRLTSNNFDSNEHWLSISDLMAGLMIVFLFISLSYMVNIKNSQERIKKIAVTYQATQGQLYEMLVDEFRNDLPKWQAIINKDTLSVQFLEPEILFKPGVSEITPRFRDILNDFFPRYIEILFSDKFRDSIAEIRIEGHTSSEWSKNDLNKDFSYFRNMELSQARTCSVLEYCYYLLKSDEQKELMKKYITANGLSSSKMIVNSDGTENKQASRRVEFRTRTNAESRIVNIIEEFAK